MKYIYLILASTFVLASCGDAKKETSVEEVISSGNLEEIRAKKKSIEEKQKGIIVQLDSLNSAISRLDTIKRLPLVTTFKAHEQIFNHYLELQGNVKTKQNILIYPEVPGILEEVFVKEGQNVVKGQLLAVIKDGGLSKQLAQAEAQEKLAKTVFDRQKRLWDQKIGSEIEFLQAETQYTNTTNLVAQLKSQLEKMSIVAPFNGTIDDVIKEKGTVIAPGQGSEVFRIINLNNMYIEAEVPEKYINTVKKETFVEVYFPVLGKTTISKIKQVGNFINPGNRSFKIEIAVKNTDREIKPNLTARLKINDYKNENAILIPQSIISENANGQQYVYTISNRKGNEGITERTIIETGKTQGDVIEVVNSLKAGVEIIKEGARSVNNGQTVEIIK